MRMFGKLALAVCTVALSASPALAQGRGGFGGGGAMLLVNKGVQEELKVTEDQASKLTTLSEELGGKQREAFQGLQDLSQEERREKMTELQKTMQAEIKKGLADILKPEQAKRFEQIQTQAMGVNAFSQPKVGEALKITADQKEKVKEITDAQQASMQEIRQSAGDDREGTMKKINELRKESFEKAAALLTVEQKTAWKDLTGAPFEVKFTPRPNN